MTDNTLWTMCLLTPLVMPGARGCLSYVMDYKFAFLA